MKSFSRRKLRVLTDQEFLLKHARNPSHSGDTRSLALQGSCKNPLCGDNVEVGIDLSEGAISQIRIQASGCGISTASASLMSEIVKGKTVGEAFSALDVFNNSLLSKTDWPDEIALLKPFQRLRESPTRIPCALIGWFALKDALEPAR